VGVEEDLVLDDAGGRELADRLLRRGDGADRHEVDREGLDDQRVGRDRHQLRDVARGHDDVDLLDLLRLVIAAADADDEQAGEDRQQQPADHDDESRALPHRRFPPGGHRAIAPAPASQIPPSGVRFSSLTARVGSRAVVHTYRCRRGFVTGQANVARASREIRLAGSPQVRRLYGVAGPNAQAPTRPESR
jgi:hypothetical protein